MRARYFWEFWERISVFQTCEQPSRQCDANGFSIEFVRGLAAVTEMKGSSMDANNVLKTRLGELYSQIDEGLDIYVDKRSDSPLPPREIVLEAVEVLRALGQQPAGQQLVGQYDKLAGEDELTQGFIRFVNSASFLPNGVEARLALEKEKELLVGSASALRDFIGGLDSGRVIVDTEGRVVSVARRQVMVGVCTDAARNDDPLRLVADRLRPWVQGRVEWWREAVCRWANNPPHHVDDQGFDAGVLPIPFSMLAYTTDERLALLAAIHDTYAEGVELVDPWRELRLLTFQEIVKQDKFGDYLKDLRYRVLLDDRIPSLREQWEDHAAKIELFVAEIEDQFSTSTGDKPHGLPEGRDDRSARSNTGLTKLEQALALLVNHPDWTDTRIAGAVGVHRTTLYKPKWRTFQRAREAILSGRDELPSGSKSGRTGLLEAWDQVGEDEGDEESNC